MGRLGIYVKDQIEEQIRDIVQQQINSGAQPGEVSISATCNDLLRMGLLMYNAKKNKNDFDDMEWKKDLTRKVSGSREGGMIMLSMLTELYCQLNPDKTNSNVDDLLSVWITDVKKAEESAVVKIFGQHDED